MSKGKTDQESSNPTHIPVYKATPMKITKVPDDINVDDDKSEVTDSMETECKKFLKKMLNEICDDCGIIT
jgi:DNA mismatch repair ATPase MutL